MKLLFSPIDIDLDNFSFRQEENPEQNNLFNPWWNSTFVSDKVIKENNFDKILDQLPFEKITRIFYKTQRVAVGPHVDVMTQMKLDPNEYDHITSNEPCGYRIVINGSIDKLQVLIDGEWRIAHLPKTPICYLINSTTLYHKLDHDPTRETIYIRGWVNRQKHENLISKSLEKFKEYALYG